VPQSEGPYGDGVPGSPTRLFATAIPGIGTLLVEELADMPLPRVSSTIEHDGRNDIVIFTVRAGSLKKLPGTRLSEDVYIEVARVDDVPSLAALVDGLWRPRRVAVALDERRTLVGALAARPTFRVVARVLSERMAQRSHLRDHLTRAIAADQPRWRVADPADLEFWVLETAPRRFRLGLRVTGSDARQHGHRREERRGALRPTVAAAMVRLAGPPRGRLVDLCCGAGTIVGEAETAGWAATGADIDADALSAARANLGRHAAPLLRADAAAIPLKPAAVTAVVSNLPFGRQYSPRGRLAVWYGAVLDEVSRVLSAGGRAVLLASPSPLQAALARRPSLVQTRAVPIRLLGSAPGIVVLERSDRSPPA